MDKEIGDVLFYGDGTPIDNEYYLKRLSHLSESSRLKEDNYSLGGSVTELETSMAKLLAKEQAVLCPQGP